MMTATSSVYVFPERALARWVRENLRMQVRTDGGLEARFRYEGSTCGNIAFEFIYCVALSPSATGQTIEAMRCEPGPLAAGHTRMCWWQEGLQAPLEVLKRETPLLGEPLSAVLTWRPQRSPAGCLCAEPSRYHKWQAVLETIHFALHRAGPSATTHENGNRP